MQEDQPQPLNNPEDIIKDPEPRPEAAVKDLTEQQVDIPVKKSTEQVSKDRPIPSPGPKKSRKGLFILVGIVVIVVLLIGGAAFAYQLGYISIPFISPDSKKIIQASCEKLANIEQARYQFGLEVKTEDREKGREPLILSSDSNQNENINSDKTGIPLQEAPLDYSEMLSAFPAAVSVGGQINGVFRSNGNPDADSELGIIGEYSSMGTTYSVDVQTRQVNDKIYYQINKFPMISFLFMADPTMDKMIGNWVVEDKDSGNLELMDLMTFGYMDDYGLSEEKDKQTFRQVFDVLKLAGSHELIKIKRSEGEETIDGFRTEKYELALDRTNIKEWYAEATKVLKEKYSDPLFTYKEENSEKFDDPDFITTFDYLKENSTINLWLDVNSNSPRKMSYQLIYVPGDESEASDNQINIKFDLQLSDINQNIKIEEPKDAISMDELEREAEGITEDEQKIKKQYQRVEDLQNTLIGYAVLFDDFPESWEDLKDTSDEEIDAAQAKGNVNTNKTYFNIDYQADSLRNSLNNLNTTDFFTEKDYGYKKIEDNFEITYQIPLDKVSEENKSEYPYNKFVDGKNTADKTHVSLEKKEEGGTSTPDLDLEAILEEGETVGKDDESLEDPDGDGLPNFMEEIYQTDPNKKDTDQDGFDDNTEIENGFNPNGPGLLTDI